MKSVLLAILIIGLLLSPVYADGNKWFTKPPVGSQIDWGHPLSRGLVGCWLMNEGGGKRTLNLVTKKLCALVASYFSINMSDSGSHNKSNYKSPMSIIMNTGSGDGSYIDVSNDAFRFPTATSELTLLAFFRQDNFNGAASFNDSSLFYTSVGNALIYFVIGNYVLGGANSGKIAVLVRSDNNDGLTGVQGKTDIRTTYTPHIAVLTINAKKLISLYLDGNFEGSGTHTMTAGISGNSVVRIGSGSKYLLGQYYTFMMWTRALSPSEIQQLYIDPYCFIKQNYRLYAPVVAPPTGVSFGGQVIDIGGLDMF